MGVMRRWATALLVVGLVVAFIGERVLVGFLAARIALVFLGAVVVFGVTGWRLRSWFATSDQDERRLEFVFAMAYLACALSLAGFFFASEDGVRLLGLQFEGIVEEERFRRLFLIGSGLLLSIGLLPAFAAQWAVVWSGGQREGRSRIELLRASELGASALSVALAAAFLMTMGYVTHHRDRVWDVSYFKTSSPGSAVQEVVANLDQPLRVLLFFPEADLVKDEVERYFRQLDAATDHVVLETYDRLAVPLLAEEYNIIEDGSIILEQGERRELLGVVTELNQARSQLRVFDAQVQAAALRLARNRRYAYMTVGHGELNDAIAVGGVGSAVAGERSARLGVLEGMLEFLGYEVRQLGLRTGLTEGVPEDAVALMIIGPKLPFLEEELRSVREYLARGGSLLLALDPDSDFSLEPLQDMLGVEFRGVQLADPRQHMRQRGGISDRRLVLTNLFSTHPAVGTASRRGIGSGVVLAGAGYLEEVEVEDPPQVRFIVGALNTTFADENGNFQHDEGEPIGNLDVAAAIVRRTEEATMRALVYADADLFSDAVLSSLGVNAALAADGIRWLGREENLAGEVSSEADVPIVHTRAEDVIWFYLIILGAPSLVGLVGWFRVSWLERRRRSA